jgi:hypothetical protein
LAAHIVYAGRHASSLLRRERGPPKEGHGDRYGLWLDKSREDLAKIPGGPREGKVVTIYMIGEIEMEATLEWDAKWQAWTGRPVERTIRDNHETWASSKLTLETREVRPFVENRNCPDCGGAKA